MKQGDAQPALPDNARGEVIRNPLGVERYRIVIHVDRFCSLWPEPTASFCFCASLAGQNAQSRSTNKDKEENMAFFDDFANAVSTYPSTSVTLSIVDVALQTGTAGSINVNEVWRFQVRVANNGNLNMTGVTLHIEGENGTQVSTAAAGPWSAEIFPGGLNVNGHGSQDTVDFYFKAPSVAKPAGTALVRAHISTFDADLNRILINLSGHADPPSGTYSNQVFP